MPLGSKPLLFGASAVWLLSALPAICDEMPSPSAGDWPESGIEPLDTFTRSLLPSGWQISILSGDTDKPRIDVHIPSTWHGNATTAVMTLCPSTYPAGLPEDAAWRLVPIYHGRRWPAYECHPALR